MGHTETKHNTSKSLEFDCTIINTSNVAQVKFGRSYHYHYFGYGKSFTSDLWRRSFSKQLHASKTKRTA